jgi:hypothetical protein
MRMGPPADPDPGPVRGAAGLYAGWPVVFGSVAVQFARDVEEEMHRSPG